MSRSTLSRPPTSGESGAALLNAILGIFGCMMIVAGINKYLSNSQESATVARERYSIGEAGVAEAPVFTSLMRSPTTATPSGRNAADVPSIYPEPYVGVPTALAQLRGPGGSTAPWTITGGTLTIRGFNPLRLDATSLNAAYQSATPPLLTASNQFDTTVTFRASAPAPATKGYANLSLDVDTVTNSVAQAGNALQSKMTLRVVVPRPPEPECDLTGPGGAVTLGANYNLRLRGYGVVTTAQARTNSTGGYVTVAPPAVFNSPRNSLTGGAVLGTVTGTATTATWALAGTAGAASANANTFADGRVWGPGMDNPARASGVAKTCVPASIAVPVLPVCRITPAAATITAGNATMFALYSKGQVTAPWMTSVLGAQWTNTYTRTWPTPGTYTITGVAFGPYGNSAPCTATLTVNPARCWFTVIPGWWPPDAACTVSGWRNVGQCFHCTSVFATGAYQFYNTACSGRSWICGSPGTICPCNPPPTRFGFGCFAADTMITMGDGSDKTLTEVKEGDYVWNPVRGTSQRVARMVQGPEPKGLYEVRISGASVKTSRQHPFQTRTGIKLAEVLSAADEILASDNTFTPVLGVEHLAPVAGQTVWNLELEADTEDPEDHMLIADGVVTADLMIQEKVTGAPRDEESRLKAWQEAMIHGPKAD